MVNNRCLTQLSNDKHEYPKELEKLRELTRLGDPSTDT